jgi:hypothetical protein
MVKKSQYLYANFIISKVIMKGVAERKFFERFILLHILSTGKFRGGGVNNLTVL